MIHYSLSFPDPKTHYIRVAVRVDDPRGSTLDFAMPVWAPGSYEVHDFAGKVHGVVVTGPGGKRLPVSKTDKATWRVRCEAGGPVTFTYDVFSFASDVDMNWLDQDRATVNGPGAFVYVVGRKDEPVQVAIDLPKAWKSLNTGLEPVRGKRNAFTAADYDELIDCPIMAGNFAVEAFRVRGVPHYVVFVGPSNHDSKKLIPDMKRIVQAAVEVFGEIPYKHYTFFMEMSPEGWGGLEHRNSTHMIFPQWRWRKRKDYIQQLGLISHEFFHTWNVKRLRPAPLGPFDYTKEVYTPLLWFAEGFTQYYDEVLLRRCGAITPREYLTELAREFRRLNMTPGRRVQSLEESSLDTWVKFYRPHADSPNTTISYYNKGAIFGWILDLEIRRLTRGRKCLDDLMRLLYRRFWKDKSAGFTTADVEAAAGQVAGRSLKPLFDRTIRGRAEVDYDRHLAHAGLETADKSAGDEDGERKAYLGIRTKSDGGNLHITQVLAGSPMAKAGAAPRDEIVAVDGFRMSDDRLDRALCELGVGATVPVLLARNGRLRTTRVRLAPRTNLDFAIQPKKSATAEQKALCRDWLGQAWNKVDKPKSGPDFRPRERVM